MIAAPLVNRPRWWSAAVGSAAAVVGVVVLAAAMFPLRSHLSVATTALVLVVPVVVGASLGGFWAGTAGTIAGFVVYDYLFIPPYYKFSVGAAQNWTALGVYAVVTVVVARVVDRMNATRADAQVREADLRRVFDLSELLVRESASSALLESIVTAVRSVFALDGVALLLPVGEELEVAASAGVALSADELRELSATSQVPVSLERGTGRQGGIQVVALAASGQGIGILALRGLPSGGDNELLRAFANHLALALERMGLREQAVRAEILEETDRLRRSLVGAVSHDLRTPLATIKVATTSMLDPEVPVTGRGAQELIELVDLQADRLDRLVGNLLDMTRIQSGALDVRRRPERLADLVSESVALLGSAVPADAVRWHGRDDLPPVDVDRVLICQALANLIDNAVRYAPEGTTVDVRATPHAGSLVVSVTDRGPGVPRGEWASIFQMFNQREAGGRGGLGLAIARAFVEAHGQRIWVEDAPGGGARFVFSLPVAAGG